jgi:hypothetical protein
MGEGGRSRPISTLRYVHIFEIIRRGSSNGSCHLLVLRPAADLFMYTSRSRVEAFGPYSRRVRLSSCKIWLIHSHHTTVWWNTLNHAQCHVDERFRV